MHTAMIDARHAPGRARTATAETTTPYGEAVERLRGMFLDVPGTRLSVGEAARLSGVEHSICGDVLEALFQTCFLKRGLGGTFIRRQADTVDR
jgi:hypothetical protein